jgi:hypothetical protein
MGQILSKTALKKRCHKRKVGVIIPSHWIKAPPRRVKSLSTPFIEMLGYVYAKIQATNILVKWQWLNVETGRRDYGFIPKLYIT